MIRVLLSAGAKVNLQEEGGASPLHVACFEGHTEVVCVLLSEGAEVDLPRNSDGGRPLHAACHSGHVGVVRALLSGGAKLDLQNTAGLSPLHVA